MFSVTFKGEQNPKNPLLAKIKMVLYKSGYPRVEKLIPVSGDWKDWDPKAQRFKGTSAQNTELNVALSNIHRKYIQLAEQWENENLNWEPKHLAHYFDNPKNLAYDEKKILTVSQVYDIRIKRLAEQKKIRNGEEKSGKAYSDVFRRHKKLMFQFVKEIYGRDFSTYFFTEIDEAFLENFVYYIERNAIKNGNKGGMRNKLYYLHRIVEDAQRKGIRGADIEIFRKVDDKFKEMDNEPRTIPYPVLLQLENLDRSLISRKEEEYLDVFLFCFYCGGMAPVDGAYLKHTSIDLKESRMAFPRMKTGKTARPYYLPKAKAIAEKYKRKCYGDYVLPILNARHDSESKKTHRIAYYEKCVNEALERFATIIGYKGEIKFYACRGTYITRMIDIGVHPMVVAEHSGNSPETIYKFYWKNTNEQEVKKVVLAGI